MRAPPLAGEMCTVTHIHAPDAVRAVQFVRAEAKYIDAETVHGRRGVERGLSSIGGKIIEEPFPLSYARNVRAMSESGWTIPISLLAQPTETKTVFRPKRTP